jgi:hypothetical protein
MFSKTVLILTVIFIRITVFAQTDKLGGWNVINLMYKPSKHLTVYAETQARSQRLLKDFFYHEAKVGIGYNMPKKFSVLFGIGDYRTYSFPGNFKDLQTKEFRMWEQFAINSNIDRVNIDHRYRIEQRWLNGTYRNRFRYRLNTVLPINGKTLAPHVLYATAFDEVFFTSKAPYFERNRFFVGAGYYFSKVLALQSGFVRQYDYRKTDDGSGKNFIQTTLFISVDHSTITHEHRHPSTMD